MSIGDTLSALMLQRGTNVNKLSLETGVSPSTLYSIIKRNNSKVDLDDLQLIADALGVTLSSFVGKTANIHPSTLSFSVEAYEIAAAFDAAPTPIQGAAYRVLEPFMLTQKKAAPKGGISTVTAAELAADELRSHHPDERAE